MSALLIIDVQNDFMDDGAFQLKGAKSIVPPINKLLEKKWDLVVACRDWHPADHDSFATTRGVSIYSLVQFKYKEGVIELPAWPVHCVQGTWGAEFDKDLHVDAIDKIVSKGVQKSTECFSAFRDIFKRDETELNSLLKSHNIEKIYMTGLVTEYCVSKTALDGADYGYEVIVVDDCIYPVDKESGSEVLLQLVGRGIEIVQSSEI